MSKIDSLDAVLADAKQRLADAPDNRKSPVHTPVVVTGDGDARVMVLRAFDPDAMTLRFHTDARAPKVAVVERDPSVTMLGYDKPGKIQLRVRGRGRIERDSDEADAAWAASDNFARRCYLAPHPPSSAHDAPLSNLPPDLEGEEPDDARLEDGEARDNFAILVIEIDELDWFTLSHEGHRRALWRREGAMTWLAP